MPVALGLTLMLTDPEGMIFELPVSLTDTVHTLGVPTISGLDAQVTLVVVGRVTNNV